MHILKGWSTTADNFRLRFLEEPPAAELQHALQELKRPDFWDARETQEKLLSSLPEYRLSKFQRALPHKYAIEMVRDYLIDIPRTLAFLA